MTFELIVAVINIVLGAGESIFLEEHIEGVVESGHITTIDSAFHNFELT
jgi:hypothetical protein